VETGSRGCSWQAEWHQSLDGIKERRSSFMKWFGKRPGGREIAYELAAIANCAVHPKFLDDAVVTTAKVDSCYLNFSEHLHDFVDAVEERFAVDGRLKASFVQDEWARHMSELPDNFVFHRIAQVHFQRLVDGVTGS
jgi:hypothetical protein